MRPGRSACGLVVVVVDVSAGTFAAVCVAAAKTLRCIQY